MMKTLKQPFWLILLFLIMSPTIARAASDVYRMDVGEEDTFQVPYSVTSNSITGYYWSNNSPSAVEIVSSSFYSIKVRVLSYQYSRALLQLDYYLSDGRRETYDLYIDIRKPDITLSASPGGGTVKKGQYVELTCNKNNADIYYTLNGSTPYVGGQKYDKWYGIEINESCTLKAIAAWGGAESDILEERYYVEEEEETKLTLYASPSGGKVSKGTTVYLTASEYGSDIYYTLNGSTPSRYDNYYSSGITINESCTLKAIAYKSGFKDSDVLTEYYTVSSDPGPGSTEPTSITVSPSSKTIKVGDSFTATYTLSPSNASTSVTWTSDDSSIASVSSSGKVTGKKAGTTNIYATTSNGKSDYCKVTVGSDSPSPSGSIEINATNFPDANFRKYLLGEDYGKDGVITRDEINKITSIDVKEMGIESLKGLEFFTALKTLECASNRLTSLDVSNFIALEILQCGDNQISSLDVSKCQALWGFTCNKNQLTSLDVSRNTALKVLWCQGNQIQSLDVSRCTKLFQLYCWENNLKSLLVSNCVDLQCEGNQITSLDVSKCTDLKSLSCHKNQLKSLSFGNNTVLEKLYCYENQITSLDVSKCTALKSLSCYENQLTSLSIGNNMALNYLNCSDNQFTSLDISQCTALKSLSCYKNQLTSLSFGNNTVLEVLSCYENQITSLDVSQCTALKSISCYKNQLKSLTFGNNTTLESLYCFENQITSLDVSKCTALKSISCYKNQLTSLSFGNNTVLKDLICYDNQITSLDVSQCTALKSISCYKNQLKSLTFGNNTTLEDLSCYENQITSLDISKCTALKNLLCHKNQLKSLSFGNNTVLEELYCYDNQITSLDVSKCTALTSIICHKNQLTSLTFGNNTALEKLSCYRNLFKGSSMDNLIQNLPMNVGEKAYELYVIYNRYNDEGNVCTPSQASKVKTRGWIPLYWDTNQEKWLEYTGNESTNIKAASSDDELQNSLIYDLSGKRLTEPQKGINIIGGKKVVVK